MQTFLPCAEDFARGASLLDYRRCGKQRVEGLQILRTLTGLSNGWRNHPAVRMWEGHEEVLALYTLKHCEDWVVNRGYKDTCAQKIREMFSVLPEAHMVLPPVWIDDVAESHRSNLIRKFPEYYRSLWPDTPDDLAYVWPV